VRQETNTNLFQVIDALAASGRFTSRLNSWQQQHH
jgi:hypothetical protein